MGKNTAAEMFQQRGALRRRDLLHNFMFMALPLTVMLSGQFFCIVLIAKGLVLIIAEFSVCVLVQQPSNFDIVLQFMERAFINA